MPTALQYATNLAPLALNAWNQRRATKSATGILTNGVDNATSTITSNGQQLQQMYSQQLAAQQQRLAASNATEQGILAPSRAAGNTNLEAIQAGLAPGGEFTPYGKTFSFGANDLPNDPGYQFTLGEGNKAIEATRNAMGTRFSGGMVKEALGYNTGLANTHFNDAFTRGLQTFTSNENTFRQNQNDRYSRLKGIVDNGQTSNAEAVNAEAANANASVGASQNFANESGTTQNFTSAQIAELQTQKANALASGNIEQANAISRAIEGGLNGVQGLNTVDALKGLGTNGPALIKAGVTGTSGLGLTAGLPSSAGVIAGTPGLAATAGTITGGVGASGAAAGAGSTTAALGAPAGAASSLTGYAGGGLITSHGALVGMMTNPVTIAVAAGIIGVTALLKSQAHWEANTWVKGFQNKFDSNIKSITQQFQSAAQSGQLSKQDALNIRDEVQAAMQQYEAKRQEFAQGGKDNKKVATQALATFEKYYGPQGSLVLNQMDQTIAGLA